MNKMHRASAWQRSCEQFSPSCWKHLWIWSVCLLLPKDLSIFGNAMTRWFHRNNFVSLQNQNISVLGLRCVRVCVPNCRSWTVNDNSEPINRFICLSTHVVLSRSEMQMRKKANSAPCVCMRRVLLELFLAIKFRCLLRQTTTTVMRCVVVCTRIAQREMW